MHAVEFNQYFENFPFLKNQFVGIFAIDTLPKTLKIKKFCICNTDLSSGEGKHWFVLLRSTKKTIECFDSLGVNNDKKENLKRFCHFRGIKEIHFNETQFQDNLSESCGKFTLYFIIERMHNLDLTFDEILEELFDPEDTKENETRVINFTDNLLKVSVSDEN